MWLAFLLSIEHRSICANMDSWPCVIPPFFEVVDFNHVDFSHHYNENLLSEIFLSLLISDLAATLSSLVPPLRGSNDIFP